MNSVPTASRRESLLAISLVVLTTLLTYAPLISQLGFYRDDWYLIWTAQTQGTEGIMSLFKGDRPFIGWLYSLDYKLLGSAPWNWHVYVLLIKISGALAFLWLLRSLWPAKKIETTVMTLLFVVYPGFYQQPDAATFKSMLVAYAAAMASLALTVQAFKARSLAGKLGLTLLAVLLAAFYIFIFEALIGLEVARLLFILYFWKQQGLGTWKKILRKSGIEAIPYIIFTAGFVYWRIFLFHSTRRSTSVEVVFGDYGSLPWHTLARLIIETAKDLVETTFLAWGVPYYQFTELVDYRIFLSGALLAFLVVAASALYYFLVQKQAAAESDADLHLQTEYDWIVLGAIIVLVTTLPIILAGRNVIFGVQWDRYTYQSLLGVALLMGGLIFHVVRERFRWILLSALLISGVLTQYLSADYYRTFWKLEREAMWQLSWRAPQIEDGTTIVLDMPGGYGLAEEYEVWGPVNLAYHPDESEMKLAGQVPYSQIWVDMADAKKERRRVRDTIVVKRDYGRVIILSQPSTAACLHVLDGRRQDQTVSEPFSIQFISKYSNVGLINAVGEQTIPPAVIFGSEPEHQWCYYYQKIDLARQQADWQAAAEFADQAFLLGLKPSDTSEWLPALEAYLHVQDSERSGQIVQLIAEDKGFYAGICAQLERLSGQPAEYDRELLTNALCKGG